ncbi:9294_t:CDS:2 [Ambispora gerdemannii]|uniref:9294_t:CDS:1 n=1 Tax=Ambispora gerdemannii TaxID=144530 RepID=A0A9N8VAI6_9GLOM|nr:9294_t:CDS:2 [Ambispora gerdemannii]
MSIPSSSFGKFQSLHNSLKFLNLCRKIGIPVDATTESLIIEEKSKSIEISLEKEKISSNNINNNALEALSTQKSLKEIFAHGMRLDDFSRGNPLLFFSAALNASQRKKALTTLYKCVYYENDNFAQTQSKSSQKWWGKIPIIVVDVNKKINDEHKKGVFLMLYDWLEKGLFYGLSKAELLSCLRGISTKDSKNLHRSKMIISYKLNKINVSTSNDSPANQPPEEPEGT